MLGNFGGGGQGGNPGDPGGPRGLDPRNNIAQSNNDGGRLHLVKLPAVS